MLWGSPQYDGNDHPRVLIFRLSYSRHLNKGAVRRRIDRMRVPLIWDPPLEMRRIIAVCACLPRGAAKLRVAEQIIIHRGTIAHAKIKDNYSGQGFVRGKPRLTTIHGTQVAKDPILPGGDTPKHIQVMPLETPPLRKMAGLILVSVVSSRCQAPKSRLPMAG